MADPEKNRKGSANPEHPLRTAGRVYLTVLLVGFLFLAGAALRVYHYHSLPQYSPTDDTALLSTEDALQYRYARMVARGGRIPDFDPLVHYPDGFSVRENLTTWVETVDGTLYHLFGGDRPFHDFLIYSVCLTTSLGIGAAYAAASGLWRSRRAGLFAGALYAVAVPTYSRVIGGYGTEHFAFPLLFFGFAFLIAALEAAPERGRGTRLALLAGTCFGIALGSWHLARFIFSVLAAALIALWLYLQFRDACAGEWVGRMAAWLVAPILVASLAFPILRARPLLSPLPLALLAVPLASILGQTLSRNARLARFTLLAGVLVSLAVGLGTRETGYSHVWAIAWAKLTHLGIKPADPAQLPFQARVLWIEDVRSPSAKLVLLTYGIIPILAVIGGLVGRKALGRQWRSPGRLLFLELLAAAVALYLLFQRMTGLAAFFLAVLASGSLLARRPVVLLAVFCLLAETYRSVYYATPTPWTALVASALPSEQPLVPNWRANNLELLDWIRRHTSPGEAFLARMGISPVILTYADRPIVLQSKMENREIWPRLEGFLGTLYGPEEPFYAYCRRYRVRYFLYEADLALEHDADSERYTALALQLRRDALAYRCQFHPEALKHLTLVFQNSFYRVYAVHPEGERPPSPTFAYQPTYDPRLYEPQPKGFFDDRQTPAVMRRLVEGREVFDRARALLVARRPAEALEEGRAALELNPGMAGLRVTVGLALAVSGRGDEAITLLEDEVRFFPDSVPARYYLGSFLVRSGKREPGLRQWEEGLRREPGNGAILAAIARLGRAEPGRPAP